METAAVLLIVALAAATLARRVMRTLSGRDNTCGCACSCNAPKTADCGGCPTAEQSARNAP